MSTLPYRTSNLKRELLATTILATLALAASGPRVFAQDAGGTSAGGTIPLPEVEVTSGQGGGQGEGAGTGAGEGRNAPSTAYSPPAVAQNTTKLAVPTFELPIAVNTVPEQVIWDQQDFTIDGALENISGVRAANNNVEGYIFNIRGFDSFNIFRDGLKIGFSVAQTYDTSNIQDIQVLKGPASFIFGRADPGGVINILTKKPLGAYYNSVSQNFGSFNLYRTVWDFTGPAQLPLLDNGTVSYRFMGSYTNGGEFPDFITNSKIFVAPALTWAITPSTTLTVDAQYLQQDAQSFVGIPAIITVPNSTIAPGYPAILPRYRSFGEPNQPPDTVSSSLIAYEFRHEFDKDWALTNRFLYARGNLVKDNLTGGCFQFDPFNNDGACSDANFNLLPGQFLVRNVSYQKLDGTNYSANLDLTGKFNFLGSKNDVLIGADYFYQYFNYILSANGNFPIDIYNPLYGTVPPWAFSTAPYSAWTGRCDFCLFSANGQKNLGVYAQDLITLWDKLHILLGVRYDLADVRSGSVNNFNTAAPFPAFPTIAEAMTRFGTNPLQHSEYASPRFGLNYEVTPWLAFYGSYTQSFGAPNGISSNNLPLPPEIAEGWEGGAKVELADQRLTATLAFFDITKSNILTPENPNDPFSELRPIGKARSQGAELDVLGKITDQLSVIASYSHITAKVVQDNAGLLGLSLARFAPNSGSVFLAYDFPAESGLEGWRVGGGVFAAGRRFADDQNTIVLPAYARLDAFAKYQFVAANVRWSAQINVNNILDTRYYPSTDFFYNNVPRLGILPGAPRNIIATLRAEY